LANKERAVRQICVIGLGQFGDHLARTLVKMRCEVLAIDLNEARVEAIRDHVHRAIIGDSRDRHVLESVLPHSIDEAVVALGEKSIEPSVLTTLNLARMGIESIRCTAVSDDHAEILQAVGATDIIFPERESAGRTSRRVATPDLKDMFSLSEDYRIMELTVPKKMAGQTLAELDLRKDYDVLVLAVRPPDQEHYRFLPAADTKMHPEETLMILGRELDLARLAGS
jgi:trk system potassium uptake protein TrkA